MRKYIHQGSEIICTVSNDGQGTTGARNHKLGGLLWLHVSLVIWLQHASSSAHKNSAEHETPGIIPWKIIQIYLSLLSYFLRILYMFLLNAFLKSAGIKGKHQHHPAEIPCNSLESVQARSPGSLTFGSPSGWRSSFRPWLICPRWLPWEIDHITLGLWTSALLSSQ